MFVDQAATLTTLPVSLVETVSAEAVRISFKNVWSWLEKQLPLVATIPALPYFLSCYLKTDNWTDREAQRIDRKSVV